MKISAKKYAEALVESLKGAADSRILIRRFLTYLMRKKQMKLLPKILRAFEEEWRKHHGMVSLTVSTPQKFEEVTREFSSQIQKHVSQRAEVHFLSDDQLIGGFRILYEDNLLDAIVSGRLQKLASRLK